MRLAVFADVHGNYHALEAALEDIQRQKVDQIIIAGDLLNGLPSSKESLDLINKENILFIRGNHERYVFDYSSPNAPASWQSENFAPVRWVIDKISKKDVEQLRNLPMFLQYDNLLITHSAPYDDYFAFNESSPKEQIEEAFRGFNEKYVLRGHSHRWQKTDLKSKQILTFNALGLPMTGKRETAYIIAEKRSNNWCFEKRLLNYDFEAALDSFDSSGYLDYSPMALLTREELIRAEAVVYPFILAWKKGRLKGKKLSVAVNDFLNNYLSGK